MWNEKLEKIMKKIIFVFVFLTSCVNNYYIFQEKEQTVSKEQTAEQVKDSLFTEHITGRNGEKLFGIYKWYFISVDTLLDSVLNKYRYENSRK
jgi:hypothetical protein